MARKLASKPVVIIGLGWSGSILAYELASQGIEVLALERGPWRDTGTDFNIGYAADELRYSVNFELYLRTAQSTLTIRNKASETALPIRQWGAFGVGNGVGGGGVHWNGQTWRYQPEDFKLRSYLEGRYGKKFLPENMTIADWPLSFDELEPFYDKMEKVCGTSGKAGNLRGQLQQGGNHFEGARSNEYPTRPLTQPYGPTLFAEAATKSGYNAFPQPCSNLSEAYVNPLGVRMGQCTYCGYCERFACANYSKSSPQACILPALMRLPNFSVRPLSEVLKINLDSTGKKATGVTYADASGQMWEQPADVVLVCAYAPFNTRLLLLSGIGTPYDPATGKGSVGKNYSYQMESYAQAYFENKHLNPFIATGANGMVINDFNGDNFDHSDLGFVGGAYMGSIGTNGRPINGFRPVIPGSKTWGSEWKASTKHNYQNALGMTMHGSSYAYRDCYLDLDPTYKDPHGLPLLRMTFDYQDNEVKMSEYVTNKAADIISALNPVRIVKAPRKGPFNVALLRQSDHNHGGTMMGSSPENSVTNRYGQIWDVPNVFIGGGASLFPQAAGYNPTNTVGALAYWVANAINMKYLKNPGQLM